MEYPKKISFFPREGYANAKDRMETAFTDAGISFTSSDYGVSVDLPDSATEQLLRRTLIECHRACPYGRNLEGVDLAPICGNTIDVHCHVAVTTKK